METMIYSNQNQTKNNIIRCLKAKLVPFIQSSPGIGKSSIVKQIAEEFNLKLIDHRLSTSAPEDLLGLPHFENGRAVFSPFRDLFPLEDSPLPKDKDGWLLFFDEFNSAPRSIQAACYKIILDREVGQYKLNKNCLIVCAGNLMSDNAITYSISTAMQSRMVHITMVCDFNNWLENVAFKERYDDRIIGFLNAFPDFLMKFDPDSSDRTFACPRTWEFVNKILQVEPEVNEEVMLLLSGTITSEIAIAFQAYCKVASELVQIKEILADPEKARIADKAESRWATILHLVNKIDKSNIDKIAIYIDRLSVDFAVIFWKAVLIQHGELKTEKAFKTAFAKFASYFGA